MSDKNASGARSYLGHYTLPQYEPSGATVYVWVGAFLADGSFYQAGTATNYPGCTSKMSEFSQGFAPNGTQQLAIDVSCGVSIPTYAPFAIYERGSSPGGGGVYEWIASGATGTLPGSSFYTYSVNTGGNTPYAVAELSSSNPISSSSQLGPVGANPALQTEFSGSAWLPTFSATAYYGYEATCPPTDVIPHGSNWISMGTGLNTACTRGGATLWSS